jgi:hypothetical protein
MRGSLSRLTSACLSVGRAGGLRLLGGRWAGFRRLDGPSADFRVLVDRWLGFRLRGGGFLGSSGFKAGPVYHRGPSPTAGTLAPRMGARPGRV